jgi:hypothetical protein
VLCVALALRAPGGALESVAGVVLAHRGSSTRIGE